MKKSVLCTTFLLLLTALSMPYAETLQTDLEELDRSASETAPPSPCPCKCRRRTAKHVSGTQKQCRKCKFIRECVAQDCVLRKGKRGISCCDKPDGAFPCPCKCIKPVFARNQCRKCGFKSCGLQRCTLADGRRGLRCC